MICPTCGAEMQPGRLMMKMPLLSLNFFYSSKDAYFQEESGKRHLLLRSSKTTEAYRCAGCGAVVVPGGKGG